MKQIFTLLGVSFKYILISLTTFIGIPNSFRILHTTSHLTESQSSLKFVNN
jgi:hypothetical protein